MVSGRSTWEGNVSLGVADLRQPDLREACRHDTWRVDPRLAGPVAVSDQTYAHQPAPHRQAMGEG